MALDKEKKKSCDLNGNKVYPETTNEILSPPQQQQWHTCINEILSLCFKEQYSLFLNSQRVPCIDTIKIDVPTYNQ